MKPRPLAPLGRSRPDTIASHERAVERVIALMHDRLDEELSLRTMAGVANMSAFHFNRTFHQVTGLPPRHFLSALRLDRARPDSKRPGPSGSPGRRRPRPTRATPCPMTTCQPHPTLHLHDVSSRNLLRRLPNHLPPPECA